VKPVIVLHGAPGGQGRASLERTLLPRLPYAKRLQIESSAPPVRLASLAALDLLLLGAARVAASPLDPARLCFPEGGKPYVEGGPEFSIAHCASRVAVALCVHGPVGIDVEESAPPAGLRASLADWTATEAVLKALGCGLRESGAVTLAPDRTRAHAAGRTLYLQPLALAAGVVARLASLDPEVRPVIEEVPG
jgi:phosphopantetheinyl transferase